MLEWIINLLSWTLLLTGGVFGIIGGLGLLRFPDFFSRMHAAGMTETMCATCIIFGLVLQAGFSLVTLKLLIILLFLLFTAPTASHALARAAMLDQVEPILDERSPRLSDFRD